MSNEDYMRGYEEGFRVALKYHGKKIVNGKVKKIKDEFAISGLTKGQVEVIKMQFERFGATPNQEAKIYKKPLRIMRMIADGRLHASIKARNSS